MKIIKSEQESTFLSIVENSPDFIMRYDRKLRHIYVNKAGIRILGGNEDQILGKTHRELGLFDQAQCDYWEEKLGNVFSSGISCQEQIEWNNNEGTLWFDSLLTPEADGQGNINSVLGVLRNITKYKLAEKKQSENEEMFMHFMEHSPIYVFFKDADIRSFLLSKNYEVMLGRPLDELLGKTMDDLFPSDLAKKMIADDKDILKKGVPAAIEEEFNGKYYTTIKFPILIKGEPLYLAGYTIDITDQKKAEKAVFVRETKLQSIFKAAPVGIGLVVNRVMMEVNDALCSMTGYARDELIGSSAKMIYPTIEEFEYVGDVKYGQISKYGIGSVETRLKCKDGKVIDVIVSSVPLDKKDNTKGVTFTVLDITSRKKAENELKESHRSVNTLISNLRGIVYRCRNDIDYTMEFLSEGTRELTGYSPKELLRNNKTSYGSIIHIDDRDFVWKKIQSAIEKRQHYQFIYRIITKSGEVRWVWEKGAGLYSQDGNLDFLEGFISDITDSKNIEEALKQSESKFRSIAENLSDLIFITDKEGIIKYISPASKMFGYKPEECIGKFFGEFLSSGEFEKAMPVFKNALNSINTDKNVTLLFKRSDGSTFFAELSGSTYKVGNEISGVIGLLRDITNKVTQDNELRKLSRVVEQSPTSILITDLEGNIEYVNPKLCKLTGFSNDELIGKTPRIFSSGEKSKKEYKALWDTINAGNDWKGEFHNVKKNGDLYWESAVISPIIGSTGELTHFLAIKEDITDKKVYEQRLIESEKRYYELFISNPLPTYVFDMDSLAFIEVNDATVNTYGYTRQEFASMTLTDIRLPEDIPELIESVRSLNNDGYYSTSMRHVKKDGTVFPVEINSFQLPEKDGRKSRLVMAADITERLRTAEAMKIAKEKAEASDKLKTTFLNNISHEVRTPLNGILGFAELIAQPDLSEEEKKDCHAMLLESSDRLLFTITNFMDISLIISGNVSVQNRYFVPANILRSIYNKYTLICSSRDLELLLDIPEKHKEFIINSDPDIFQKIITHLLYNAIKFTEDGSIKLGYIINDTSVDFFVKDTGIGIGKESINKVFDRFVKEDRGPMKLSEGSGLGLSIVKGMIDLLGGEIKVESEIDIGSTFYITLPFIKGIDLSAGPVISRKQQKSSSDKILILVAEDDETNFFYLNALLTNEIQATILHASNGREAVELFKVNPGIQLILMDIKMPVLDGFEATRQIKLINKDIPIIAVTAYAMLGDEERVLAAGCDGYLSKPISKHSLLDKITEFVKI